MQYAPLRGRGLVGTAALRFGYQQGLSSLNTCNLHSPYAAFRMGAELPEDSRQCFLTVHARSLRQERFWLR